MPPVLTANDTPLAALAFEQWHPNGATMAVVVARARVRVDPDGTQYLEEGDLALADRYDGDPHAAPMIAAGDLVPYRPFADVTVRGALHAPEPRARVEGGIAVGGRTVRLRGCGPRTWHHDRIWRLSEPEPVAEVPLDWRLAAGGRIVGDPDGGVDPRNPIGPGIIHPDYTSERIELPAPRIDNAAYPVTDDPYARPEPQGLGPVPPWWLPRQRLAGTYDKAWEDEVHPRLPRDFDYRHYQVAPPNLILDGYLRPGVEVRTKGLRPGGEALSLHLPDLALWATFTFRDGRSVPVRLHCDGLHLDLTGEVPTFDLTWRTWIETCPSFEGVSLAPGRWEDLIERRLAIAGPEGLVEDQAD